MLRNSDFGTFGRYTELQLDEMTADQRKAYEFTAGPREEVPGPYKIWPNQRETINMLKVSGLQVAATALMLGTLAVALPARAALTTKAGMLSCHVDRGFGFVFGSSRSLACTYTSAKNGRVEHYTGDISKFGVDIGYLQSGVIVWAVLAPTTDLAPGALGGTYVGITAGGSVGAGADANVLTGGSTHAFSLQPISIEGDEGLNVAAGIGAITLQYAS